PECETTPRERIGKPIGAYSLLIAGQALSRGLTLVTANTRGVSSRGGSALKNYLQLIVVFAIGLGAGLLARRAATTPAQPPAVNPCGYADTDSSVICRMHEFQNRLDELKKPRTASEDITSLSKEIEAQAAILGLMTKFREKEFAKFSAFSAL